MRSVIIPLGERTFAIFKEYGLVILYRKSSKHCSDCTLVQKCFIKKWGGGSCFSAGPLWGWAKRSSFCSAEGWDETCGCWVERSRKSGGWLQPWCPCISGKWKVIFGTVHVPTPLHTHFTSPAEAQDVGWFQRPHNDFWTSSKSCFFRVLSMCC